jgi:hypothetical protein
MVGRKRWLAIGSVLLFVLGSILWADPAIVPSSAAGKGGNNQMLSLDVEKERLESVFKLISKSVGYEIIVNEGWTDVLVTLKLKDATLEETIRRVTQGIGKPNHMVLTDDKLKRIEISIFGLPPEHLAKARGENGFQLRKTGASLSRSPGSSKGFNVEPGLPKKTPVENIAKVDTNSGEIEVIPPARPGGKGITLGQINALRAKGQEAYSPDVKVIPPGMHGAQGITLKQVKKALEQQTDSAKIERNWLPK